MNQDQPLLKWTFACMFAVAVCCWLIFVAGCSKSDLPTSRAAPPLVGWIAAKGQSMGPTFPESALLEFEVVAYEALKLNDTVIFWDYTRGGSAPSLIHHRLVAKQGGNWIAQGDNAATNKAADRPWVTKDNYLARTTGRHAQILFAP